MWLLLLLLNIVYPQYQTEYRIGYSTGNRENITNTFNSGYEINTYSPGTKHPRKIPVIGKNGDTLYTPGGDNDSKDWDYKYYNGTWWTYKNGSWYRWVDYDGWFITIHDWTNNPIVGIFANTTPDSRAEDYSPIPIGDNPIPTLLFCLSFYAVYIKFHDKKKIYKNYTDYILSK